MRDLSEHKYLWGVMAATALALVLAAAPAGANEDPAYQDDQAYSSDEEYADEAPAEDSAYAVAEDEVLVTAPRRRLRGDHGAPIRDVAMSREVSFADLDLTTRDGAHALEARVRQTARNLCRQLDVMHPVKADDSPPCYETAVEGAMIQAEAAIADARGINDAE
jgi:UrcA family protein